MGRRHILVNGKKVYLLPAQERDALQAAKPGDVRWAECDARGLAVADLDLLSKKLPKSDQQKLDAAIALADAFKEALDHADRGVIYCNLGCERTSTVAALLLRKHFGLTTDDVLQRLRAAYKDEPQFEHQYVRRPETHLKAYDRTYR